MKRTAAPPRSTTGTANSGKTPVKKKRKRGPGWVPNQHGAWTMLASPFVVGIIAAGPAWVQIPLAVTWFVGYFAFFALSLWLKSRRRAKYLPPVRAYGIATFVAGLTVLLMQPSLALWAPPFVALSAVSLYEASQRRDRSLLSGVSTVLAAGGMTYVVMAAAGPLDVARATFLTLAQLGYLLGVLLYVKTMIRERGNADFLRISIGWHLLITVAAAAWAITHPMTWWLVGAYALLLVRAIVLPRKALRPKKVGLMEIPLHVLVVVAALLA